MRVMEPELWSEENIAKVREFHKSFNPQPPEEYLSAMEEIGGEDKSFRDHVKQHIEKWDKLGDDPYWNFDKRIYTWINRVFESKIRK